MPYKVVGEQKPWSIWNHVQIDGEQPGPTVFLFKVWKWEAERIPRSLAKDLGSQSPSTMGALLFSWTVSASTKCSRSVDIMPHRKDGCSHICNPWTFQWPLKCQPPSYPSRIEMWVLCYQRNQLSTINSPAPDKLQVSTWERIIGQICKICRKIDSLWDVELSGIS